MTLSKTVVFVTVGSSAWLIYKISQIGKREPGLPPGPPTVPLLGNLHLIPKTNVHLKFTEWAKEYGDLYSLKMGPKTAVVITSVAAVREIMDKNSASTSDRPDNHIADLITDGNSLAFAKYHAKWRPLRRCAHDILAAQMCDQHLPIQQAEATQLMYDLMTRPQEFYTSIRRYSAAVIFSVLFGKRTPQYSTQDLATFFHSQRVFGALVTPGAQPPVDLIPILQKVPERFAKWKTLAKEARRLQRTLYLGLLGDVEQRMARGEGNGCFMESVCNRADEWKMDRDMIAFLGGVLVDTGSHTTSAFLQSLILQLVGHPDVQRKARQEIDTVIGLDRAPVPKDINDLPYVRAIIKEVFRLRPGAPLSIPHASTADVMYEGYRIPAGATIFVNVWGIFHDEQVFDNAFQFDPSRSIKSKFGTREELANDCVDWKEDLEFGSGRRICPGMHLAKNSIAINTMNFLWAFNFGKEIDPLTGIEIEPDLDNYSKSVAPSPNQFNCTITPRTAKHAEMIKRQFTEATNAFLPFEHELSGEDRLFVTEQRRSISD